LSHIVGAAGQYSINTLAPFYQHDLQLTRTEVGLFFSAFYLGMACLSYPAGRLADRLGVGRTTLGGHLSLGFFSIVAACAASFGWGLVCFLFAGLGYSFLNPASTKGVMAWFPSEERATAMGIKQTGVPAGGVVAALVAPSLVLRIGWRGALATLGAVNLLFGIIFLAWWQEAPRKRAPEHGGSRSQRSDGSDFHLKRLYAISFGTAVLLTAQMSLLTYLPLYLKETIGLSPYWSSQALALTQAGGMTGRVGWGMISDWIFGGRRKDVLVAIGIGSVALLWLLGLVPSGIPSVLLLVLIFLAGLCMIGYQGVSYALIGELAGTARTGSALGIVITVNSLGAILGTPLFGYIVDRTGSYPIAWAALGAAVLIGVLGMRLLLEEPPRGSESAQPTIS
jgi:MFS family permease